MTKHNLSKLSFMMEALKTKDDEHLYHLIKDERYARAEVAFLKDPSPDFYHNEWTLPPSSNVKVDLFPKVEDAHRDARLSNPFGYLSSFI